MDASLPGGSSVKDTPGETKSWTASDLNLKLLSINADFACRSCDNTDDHRLLSIAVLQSVRQIHLYFISLLSISFLQTTFKEVGAQVVQNFDPLKQFKVHFCGFAFYNGDPKRQVELHHYVASINDDVYQCAVFDSPDPGARLIGIEYVVTEKIFQTLDAEEQKLWHNHAYDITSGTDN